MYIAANTCFFTFCESAPGKSGKNKIDIPDILNVLKTIFQFVK